MNVIRVKPVSCIFKIIRLGLFFTLFVFLFRVSSNVLANKVVDGSVPDQHEMIGGFYKERPGSLDAVFLGASSVYDFYQPPIGWGTNGFAIYSYTSASQPTAAIPFLIEEVQKTQPQALIIAGLNQLVVDTTSMEKIHYLVDYMPFSITKAKLIDFLYYNGDGADAESELEFFLPIIRYHSRWNALIWQDIHYTSTGGVKAAKRFSNFLNTALDVTQKDIHIDVPQKLSAQEQYTIENILDYCDAHNTKILFLFTPQYTSDKSRDAKYLSAQQYIEDRGYTVLNLKDRVSEFDLDLTSDCFNDKHTNIHGSIKISGYLCRYLSEHYGFEDKRGDSTYADWDEAYDKYKEIITPYLTEEELSKLP